MATGWRPCDWLARVRMIPAPARRRALAIAALVVAGVWLLALLLAGG